MGLGFLIKHWVFLSEIMLRLVVPVPAIFGPAPPWVRCFQIQYRSQRHALGSGSDSMCCRIATGARVSSDRFLAARIGNGHYWSLAVQRGTLRCCASMQPPSGARHLMKLAGALPLVGAAQPLAIVRSSNEHEQTQKTMFKRVAN